MCLSKTSSVFNKNKVLNNKTSNNSTNIKKNEENLNVKKVIINIKDKKKSTKKKKRNTFAGLNPLVFKNRSLRKTNCKEPNMCL